MTGAFCLPNQSTGGEDLDDIPIEHLDYSYIKGCKDVPYLAKILDRLRSGKVGLYPHLIEFCEKHVEKLDPRCRALRKDNPAATSASVSSEEWSQIIDDMEKWQKESRIAETSLKPLEGLEKDDLPPVRGDNCCVPVSKNSKAQQKKIVSKPRDYSEWDKFDVEKECQKIDGDDVEKETPAINNSVHPKIRTALETSARTAQEKLILANHEKDKGNEAFRANDYEEAVAYYSRSISIIPTVAAFNNRAQANIKTKNWHRAMTDCQKVLEMDPGNTKGLLRRASVYKHKGDLERAAEDLRKVLEEEPNNTPASQLLSEITKQMEEPGHEKKGKRILIEEVDDEENGDEVSATARPVEPSQQQQPVGGEESSSDMGNAQRKPHGRGDGGPHCEPGNSHHHGPSRGKADKYRVPSAAADGVTNGTGKRGSTAAAAAAAADPKSPGEQTRRKSADLDAPCGALPPPLSRLKNEGNLLFKNGQFADALGKYSLAIQGYTDSGLDSPDDLCILYSNRAACYLKDGNSQECIQDCTRSLELQPFSLKPLLRRAMAYESLERYRKAYVDYKTVLQVDRSVQAAHDSVNRITKMLIEQDGPDWREKLPEIPLVPLSAQQHPREEPVSAEVLQARAEKAAKDAERRRESRFAAFKQDGNEFVKKGQFQEALAKYTECLKLKPEECAIYTNRALCYLKQDRFAEAKDDCDAALRLEPANKKAFYRRAMANKGLKDYQACRADLEEVLQLDPSVQEARTELEEVTTLIQQDKPSPGKSRKVVPITEVDSSREASPPPDSRTDDVSINLHPINAYEFGQALNAAHSGGNMAACAQILSNTAPEKLPQLLSKHLDASILLFIMQALDSHLMDQNPDLVYRHLNHLHTAGRFSVVLVLLEKDKHAQMAQMFDRLSAVKSTEFTRNDVQNLAAKYQVQA